MGSPARGNNIGGESDSVDPRDLADLEDPPINEDEKPPNPAPLEDDKDDKGELPPSEEDENTEDETEEEDEEDSEDIEEVEDDGEEKDEIEEEDVEINASTKPSWAEINKKYPKFFKEFPAVRDALGRELAFSKVFPSVQDAKDAGSLLESFNELQTSIISGDSAVLLGRLHENNPKALNKFVKNFLPTVQRGNPELFDKIVTPLISRVLRNALENAQAAGNDNLAKSVRHMARFIYNDAEGKIPPDPKEEKEDSGEVDETTKALQEENRNLHLSTLNRFSGDVKDATEKILEKQILKDVDPNNALPEFVREALVAAVIKDIIVSLKGDKNHSNHMTSLWQNARRNGYSKEDRSQLISAFLARARKILPSIRDRHKKEVLKKIGAISANRNKDNKEGNTNRRRIPESGAPSHKTGTPRAKEINWRQTSDEDILSDRYVPRR